MVRLLLVALLLAAAAPAAADSGATRLVAYTRTGGFVGVHETLSVRSDGRAVADGDVFRLSARRLAAVKTAVRRARFATLAPKYLPESPLSDGFTFTVAHGGRKVIVEEGANTPARLDRLLELLADIHARKRQEGLVERRTAPRFARPS
jgi:hypothetical protein